MLDAAVAGFALGLSLIMAIGAQNAFVLRQGLRRSHVLAVCLTCALSDALLIVLGVAGMGWLALAVPGLDAALRWGGAAFLTAYGALSLRSAWRGSSVLAPDDSAPRESLGVVLATCMALTWANPHVYLDTVVLLGSVAAAWGASRAWFGAGAVVASFAFFFALGYGARMLAPMFARPGAWRALDAGVGLVMLGLAGALVLA